MMSSPSEIRDDLDLIYGNPTSIISQCLRGFIVPRPGYDFIGCDFSSVEARVTAWLAGEERLLTLYREGGDPYVDEARGIYNCTTNEVTEQRRQVGKTAVLALGFGGGKGAFQIMAKAFGVKVTDKQAEGIKEAWRRRNPNIVQMWYALEDAAIKAVKTGTPQKTHFVQYRKSGSFLLCRLPSGREICYPYPKVELKATPWGEKRTALTAKWVNGTTRKWERRIVWYGILTENIVQAVARDLLVNSILRLEATGFAVVMHVHDEILLEIAKTAYLKSGVGIVQELMSITPTWAEDLPLTAKGWRGNRYRK